MTNTTKTTIQTTTQTTTKTTRTISNSALSENSNRYVFTNSTYTSIVDSIFVKNRTLSYTLNSDLFSNYTININNFTNGKSIT